MSSLPTSASAVELDSNGYARIIIKGTPGAEQLWIEVEDPALNAANTAITVDGQAVSTLDTALGAAAVVTPGGKDVAVTIGLSVTADPDIAFTAVDATGTALYTEHYRTAMTAARAQTQQPTEPAPTVTATVAPAVGTMTPAAAATEPKAEAQGALPDTGAVLGMLLPFAAAALALGLGALLIARKKARA